MLNYNLLMRGGAAHSPTQNIRIGEMLKSNQSITYSESQSQFQYSSPLNVNPYGAQIYLQNRDQDNLPQKYLMVCMEIQRLNKLATKHQTLIFNLTQEIQIRTTDIDAFRQREDILQRELKKLQEQDKLLLANNHKLEQMLLEKNRLTALLEEELIMARNRLNSLHPKDNLEDKTRIRELEQMLSQEKSRNVDLDRQLKEATINLQRYQARISTKLGTDRSLLINAENRIKELQEQLRVYVAQKRMLEQNQLRFSQQQRSADQSKMLQFSKHIEKLEGANTDLANQRSKTSQQISGLEKQLHQALIQLKARSQYELQYQRQITSLEGKIQSLNELVMQRERSISLLSSQKTQLQYRVQSVSQQLRRVEDRYKQYQSQPCRACPQLSNQNSLLKGKITILQEAVRSKDSEYKMKVQQSQKELRNLKQLLQSVNTLKGSNERVSRLIEVSASKLQRTTSSKFFSTATL